MSKFDVELESEIEVFPVGIVKSVKDLEVVSRIQISRREAKMRDRLTVVSFVLVIASLFLATLIGLHDGNYKGVGIVWALGGGPLWWMVRSYFRKG